MNEITGKRRVFTGRVINVDEVDLDFGKGGKRTFEQVTFNSETGVAALPINERGNLVLVEHFQIALGGPGLTLPTGGLDVGEKPEERMQLELQEELGYKAGKLTLLNRFNVLPSYLGETAGYLYLAEQLTPSKLEGDEPFEMKVVEMTIPEALQLIEDQKIACVRTICAILHYKTFILK